MKNQVTNINYITGGTYEPLSKLQEAIFSRMSSIDKKAYNENNTDNLSSLGKIVLAEINDVKKVSNKISLDSKSISDLTFEKLKEDLMEFVNLDVPMEYCKLGIREKLMESRNISDLIAVSNIFDKSDESLDNLADIFRSGCQDDAFIENYREFLAQVDEKQGHIPLKNKYLGLIMQHFDDIMEKKEAIGSYFEKLNQKFLKYEIVNDKNELQQFDIYGDVGFSWDKISSLVQSHIASHVENVRKIVEEAQRGVDIFIDSSGINNKHLKPIYEFFRDSLDKRDRLEKTLIHELNNHDSSNIHYYGDKIREINQSMMDFWTGNEPTKDGYHITEPDRYAFARFLGKTRDGKALKNTMGKDMEEMIDDSIERTLPEREAIEIKETIQKGDYGPEL